MSAAAMSADQRFSGVSGRTRWLCDWPSDSSAASGVLAAAGEEERSAMPTTVIVRAHAAAARGSRWAHPLASAP
jgi:hypothetical protein